MLDFAQAGHKLIIHDADNCTSTDYSFLPYPHHYIATTTRIQGFGKKNPVAPNSNSNGSDNPAGRAQNRRVEVLIDTYK
jgi:hypothetical protein